MLICAEDFEYPFFFSGFCGVGAFPYSGSQSNVSLQIHVILCLELCLGNLQ